MRQGNPGKLKDEKEIKVKGEEKVRQETSCTKLILEVK